MVARVRRPAFVELVALTVSLAGLLGLIVIIWELKQGATGIPRTLYLLSLAMICAPFGLVLSRNPKPIFYIAPCVVIFLLYPVLSPQGVVWGPDPIFNYSFTETVVESGFWIPGAPTAFATVYSFYPIGNVFMAYIILAGHLPGVVAFNWIELIVRLLAVPAMVFSIGRRLFNARIAMFGLFLYLGTASILFNEPVQQGMGVVFVGLSLLALVIVTQTVDPRSQRRAHLLFGLAAAGVVMTHHLSSYIFAGWIAALAILVSPKRFAPLLPRFRLTVHTAFFLGLMTLYIFAFTYPIFFVHERSLEGVIARFLAGGVPPGAVSPGLGRTFSSLEVLWIGSVVVGLVVFAFFTIRLCHRGRMIPFAVANGYIATVLMVGTLPMLATLAHDVPLRVGEYANLFLAPLAAATLVRWTRPGLGRVGRIARRLAPGSVRESGMLESRWLPPALVLGIAALVFMGGSLVPGTIRPYFESHSAWSTDSPLLTGSDAMRAGEWARAHVGHARFWGDQLAVNVFAGFADMRIDYGSSRVFVNDTLNGTAWFIMAVGDYVIVDRWMTVLIPHFLEEPEPLVPMSAAAIGKFATDPHFARVYQDETFSIYRVMTKPP